MKDDLDLTTLLDRSAEHIPTGSPPTNTLVTGWRRSQRRRLFARSTLTVAAVAAVTIATITATDAFRNSNSAPVAPVSAAPTENSVSAPTSCAGEITVGDQGLVATQISSSATTTIQVHVDTTLVLAASGPCRDDVQFLNQNDGILRQLDSQGVKAAKVGRTRLAIGHPMCAEAPSPRTPCAGGIVMDAYIDVEVRGR